MQTAAPEVAGHLRRIAGDAARSTASTTSHRELRPPVPDGPPVRRARGAVRPGLAQLTSGTSTAASRRTRPQRPGGRSADRGPAQRPEGARPARRHAGALGRRVRPHAHRPRATTAATTTRTASRCGWPAAASSRASPTARPTSTAITRSRTRSTSTTCTPRSCTCWASTTPG